MDFRCIIDDWQLQFHEFFSLKVQISVSLHFYRRSFTIYRLLSPVGRQIEELLRKSWPANEMPTNQRRRRRFAHATSPLVIARARHTAGANQQRKHNNVRTKVSDLKVIYTYLLCKTK